MVAHDHYLDSYLLEHDIRATSAEYYRRIWSVFRNWLLNQPEMPPFCAVTISRFLMDKQAEGLSSYYRRSLRGGLVAILHHVGDFNRVRSVKLEPLNPETWTTAQVIRLVGASRHYRNRRDADYWPSIIQAGYYSGLSQCDIERITRLDIGCDGTVIIRRSRTNKRAVAWLPPEVIAHRPTTGPLWPRPFSLEMFRRHFAKIVDAAGLTGTFKRLRKSSGTVVEQRYPGRGHEHLANTRAVFEKHYLSANHVPKPLLPPPLEAS